MLPFYQNIPFFTIFIFMVGAIVCGAISSGKWAFRFILCNCALAFALSMALLRHMATAPTVFVYTMGEFQAVFGNSVRCGPLQALLAVLFITIVPLSLLGGRKELFHDLRPEKVPLYIVMVHLLIAGLITLTYANDVFTAYVFIEITTISACSLVMAKDTGPNLLATFRYLSMSLLGSSLFLIGITLLNSITGYLVMPVLGETIAELVATQTYITPLTIGMGLVFAGLGIKSALFPFHLWLPDAHGGATSASSAILSGTVLKGYIVLLLTLSLRVFGLELVRDMGLCHVMLAFGIAGMIIGSLSAMREHHIKRMLAYSSVAQIGYIFMGFGMGTKAGITAGCFHILVHACCKPLLFCCAGRLRTVGGHHRNLRDLRGTAYRDLLAGVGFTIGALSMIGIPLLGGFVSKFYLAVAALESENMVLILLALALSTVLNALYYVPALLAIWVHPKGKVTDHSDEALEPDPHFSVATICLIALVFFLGIFYHPILDIISSGLDLM